VHGLFAPPASSRYEDQGLPPLVVQIHGGPTSQAYRTWRADVQFFTSRGFAFLDVNYRGSTGYGRAYREQLRGQWGVLDAADAISGLRYVAGQGWADGKRAAIRGSSAGGYTVLRVLTLEPDLFRAGVCLYGISELFSLARETHKFEAHYLDSLIGELPLQSERYRERSPIHFADRLRTPLIVFQGADDKVVPPSQSERIVAALKARGVPHEYHLYPGEGHGFRLRETVLDVLQSTERFLQTHVVHA
jgi:dipeptidyl aminopeptidase/acylaminoacyl peptidase